MKISITTDLSVFSQCADLMAGQDPWLRMGIGFEDCLEGFMGDWREVRVAEADDTGKIAGFMILQSQSTFRLYVQTLCIAPDSQRMGLGKAP